MAILHHSRGLSRGRSAISRNVKTTYSLADCCGPQLDLKIVAWQQQNELDTVMPFGITCGCRYPTLLLKIVKTNDISQIVAG
eukprot:6209704-Pleurochrysis_carterae.AAC.1